MENIIKLNNNINNNFSSDIEGDFDNSDFEFPYLQIVHPNSEIADDFPRGSFVYNRSVLISLKGEVFKIIFLKIIKEFIENSAQDEVPKTFKTMEEAEKEGYRLGYGQTKDTVSKKAKCFVLVETKKENNDLYDLDLSVGKFYFCTWNASKSAYSSMRKVFSRALRTPVLSNVFWDISSVVKTSKPIEGSEEKHKYFSPSITKSTSLTKEDFDLITEFKKETNY